MGTLWDVNDILKKERLNRASIITRLLAPAYDVDDAAAVTLDPFRSATLLGTSLTTVLSVAGSGVAVAHITRISISNLASSARTFSLYLIENGASTASVARSIFSDAPISGNETINVDLPYFLAAGASLRGLGSVANEIAVRVDGANYATQPEGLTLLTTEGVALSASSTDILTAGGSQELVLAVTACNTHSAAVQVFAFAGPTNANANCVFRSMLNAKETATFGMLHTEPGDGLYMHAGVASVIGVRSSAVRFT